MEKYVKVRKIGQGSYGSAYLATRKTTDSTEQKQQFVIKEIVLDPRDQANAQREARLLAALDHPNIISCKESFLLKPSVTNLAYLGRHHQRPTVLCIVTEFADGGDLSNELERRARRGTYFEPDELLGLFVQVCLALKHLHDRKILHRDVKPANIFLTKSGVVKVGDLGVATVLSHTLACAQTSIGTPYYTAPEICLGKRYNAKADVWSLGCVLFEMVSFIHVFDGRSQRQLFDNIVRGVTPQLPSCGKLNSIKKELQALVDDMLRKEPRARPSVNQLIRRPLVLARIQTFLSAHALASELNHTVLHGENIFRKKITLEDKPITIAQQIRRAEPVARVPSMNAVIKPSRQQQKPRRTPERVGSLLGASRKARGLPSGAFRRIQKLAQPARVPVNKANVAKQRAVPTKTKRLGSQASVQVKAKLKAQIEANKAAAAAVAALPHPPTISKASDQDHAKAHNGISERAAAFNAKWAAQKEELVKNLPPPAPSKAIAKNIGVSKPKPSARAYPKPVVIGKTLKTSKQTPTPASAGIRRQPAKQKTPISAPKTRGSAVVNKSQPSLREHRLEFQRKNRDKPRLAMASPLDDPVILVQQLPDFKTPVTVSPPPAPTTLTSSLPECADKDPPTPNQDDEQDQDLTSLPWMANLEFERMVLQLKSAIESDTTSDDEDDEDENSTEGFDPNVSPPPYSTAPTPPLESLNPSVLEDPKFRSALQKRLQQHKNAAATSDQVKEDDADVAVDPAQRATLEWMQTYITSLL
ncbi:NEK protein kinase [Phytophthora nicotianae CJ01A1]|uniref:non-specific serine/threonine protein kinase n=2 Tax=Phytophthora nicotianae TaxID=4792 RepID=W2IB15_PHYNI|nr:NEK protein kinase [Phytophthora nicotianae]ETL30568.1 NEK protein kinase [Phytophthora nicotianae]ETP06789.1 NEK protein kinase [Phytophthora nicotianae CJ01A1]